ncbi:MAG: hypothetical protein HYU39_05845 [Thaumarchaeota archaeon]|nr:hypothetical protein [Nitrososphaerota archaeon]
MIDVKMVLKTTTDVSKRIVFSKILRALTMSRPAKIIFADKRIEADSARSQDRGTPSGVATGIDFQQATTAMEVQRVRHRIT